LPGFASTIALIGPPRLGNADPNLISRTSANLQRPRCRVRRVL